MATSRAISILIVLAAFCAAGPVWAEIFGNTVFGQSGQATCESQCRYDWNTQYSPTAGDGTLDSIYVGFQSTTGSGQVVRCAIYNGDQSAFRDSTAHYTRLADSINYFVVGFAVVENVAIYADSSYTFAIVSSNATGSLNVSTESATGDTITYDASYTGGGSWPSSLTSANRLFATANRLVDVRGVYTVSATGQKGQVISIQ